VRVDHRMVMSAMKTEAKAYRAGVDRCAAWDDAMPVVSQARTRGQGARNQKERS
jgi:hypothetical protein